MLKPSLDDLLKSSIRSILKNKGRTVLTSLGIIIGVTSVILLTSIGSGLKKYVSDQFESLGSNSVYVYPGQIFSDTGGFNRSSALITVTFKMKDVEKIKRQFRGYTVIPTNIAFADISSSQKTKKSVEIAGATYEYGGTSNLIPSSGNGRWFTAEEDSKKSQVIILGNKIATDLFPSGNALGKKVIVTSKNLKIIGPWADRVLMIMLLSHYHWLLIFPVMKILMLLSLKLPIKNWLKKLNKI
jgi:putative ABC transport system permease protein